MKVILLDNIKGVGKKDKLINLKNKMKKMMQ